MADVVVIDGINYKIYQAYGEVVDGQSNTHIRSQSDYSVSSYTIKEFFIKNRQGREQFFSIEEDYLPPMRNGHMVQVMWVIPESEKTGCYVFVRNTSLGKEFLNTQRVGKLFTDRLVTGMWGVILLGLVIAIILLFKTGELGWIAASFVAYTVIILVSTAKKAQNNENELVEEIRKRIIK